MSHTFNSANHITFTYEKNKSYVVDGRCRDSSFIETIGFPVYYKYFTPRDVASSCCATELGGNIIKFPKHD